MTDRKKEMGFPRLSLPVTSLFPVGKPVVTTGAWEALKKTVQSPWEFFDRHASGDWGDLDEHDTKMNVEALEHGNRLFSAYHTKAGDKLYVITEADRSATTLLLPEEY